MNMRGSKILTRSHGTNNNITVCDDANQIIPLENGHTVHVTVSIGLSAYPMPSATLETLIADADAAMYRIKRSGRNGVLTANEESLTLPLSPP
jgi:diguanylate cyclase (GGDEF)-like protein